METKDRIRRRGVWPLALLAVVLPAWTSATAAGQSSSEPEKKEDAGPAHTVKTYEVQNGTQTYSRIEERDRKKTADGDIVTERVRMPAYPGDDRVLLEREIHTKNLPDGTIERETILKNPDGNGGMQPIEITRETIHPTATGSTVEREVSKPGFEGGWRTVQRERVNLKSDKTSSESTREVEKPDINGEWKPIIHEFQSDKKTNSGESTRSVTQVPDANGALSNYEVQTSQTVKGANGETRKMTLTRRDFSNAVDSEPLVVERTVTQEKKLPDGNVVTESTTESDLVNGGTARNLDSSHPEIVEEKKSVESPGKDGTSTTTTTVNRRGSAATDLHPSYQIVVKKDSTGHVRQIYIPSH